ncbi:hypothetical protein GCM10025782_26200 [Pedococcus ginsenosidimutans]|uniref:Uncharacterized protein n=1 Tax=Pedococcus ginsenosidimutans TaxID=490570 RepID=A0ABP8YF57_9MICO
MAPAEPVDDVGEPLDAVAVSFAVSAVSSSSHSAQPSGTGGHDGSGFQPGGGTHPAGGWGQPGGELNRINDSAA